MSVLYSNLIKQLIIINKAEFLIPRVLQAPGIISLAQGNMMMHVLLMINE